MKKYIFLLLILISPISAMDGKGLGEDSGLQTGLLNLLRPSSQEKSAEELLESFKNNEEFMSCSRWIHEKYPSFQEAVYATHPLFSLLKEGIELADFEVDCMESFIHNFMETDMLREQGKSLVGLQENAMHIKLFVGDIIDILQDKKSISEVIETYLQSRLIYLIQYQTEIINRNNASGERSLLKAKSIMDNADPTYDSLKNGFLRSYNTKNRIVRSLLYYLRARENKSLKSILSEKSQGLICLSFSLYSFLNNENDEWVNYDIALSMAEANHFLGNSKELGINVTNILREKGITGIKIPKGGFRKLCDLQMPKLLWELPTKELPAPEQSSTTSTKKKKKKNKTKGTEVAPATVATDTPTSSVTVQSLPEAAQPNLMQLNNLKLSAPGAPSLLVSPPIEKDVGMISTTVESVPKPLPPSMDLQKLPSLPNVSIKPPSNVSSTHINTILDIFRPKGYTHVNDDRIIAAWNHVLAGKGYHKENTGRSHQPLYATLSDGSRVVLGLFRSKQYGPRYIKYVQEAFEKIGFGRNWLIEQGYTPN